MHELVKIFSDDDGITVDNPVWHLVDPTNKGGPASLCQAEYFGEGESACTYETKVVTRGGITCKSCLDDIKTIKAIKL